MMFRVGSTGPNVKRALTSYEDMHSPLLQLDGFGLFHEVLGISDMVGEPPTRGQRMLAISLATPYVIEPLLDIIGLRGTGLWIWGKL